VLVAAGVLLALLILPTANVSAQAQTKKQRLCIVKMNKQALRVAKEQTRENSRCISYGAKGATHKLGPDETIEGCLTADTKTRVAKSMRKTVEADAKHCGHPSKVPDFSYSDPNTLNQAAAEQSRELIHDIFNDDLDAVIRLKDLADPFALESLAGACQEEVASRMRWCMQTRLKEFNACKDKGIKGVKREQLYPDAVLPFDEPVDVEGCIGFDRRLRIARHCIRNLELGIDEKCNDVYWAKAFPGACYDATRPADILAACVDRLSGCRVCMMLNQADDLGADCDLVDDGLANASCPPTLPSCPDGITQSPLEQCDDGNTVDGDGCSAFCMDEVCGDGIIQAPEVCDDGNIQDGDCCSSDCQTIASAGTVCRAATSDCDIAETCNGSSGLCPDDAVQSDGVVCDDGDTCSLLATCQSGVCVGQTFDPNQPTCDDGDSCTNNDRCQDTVCVGESFQPDGTSCDDSDVCTNNEECLAGVCGGELFNCGDGTVLPSCYEECDDGNTDQCDGCSEVCIFEDGTAPDRAGASCAAIFTDGLSTGDGLYWIDPDCGSKDNAIECFCGMTQGGECIFCPGEECP
jgi:cysteine-rich repeat protein